MQRVWKFSRHSGSNLLMLLAIAEYADDAGFAFPSVETLALKCRMQRRNANMILAVLRDSGELQVMRNDGPRGTNLYRIALGEGGHAAAPLQATAGMQALARGSAKHCPAPLQGLADKPSINHQETSLENRTQTRPTHFVPENFKITPELKAWAAKNRPDVDLQAETMKFREHEFRQPRSDWDRAWRQWILRARNFAKPSYGLAQQHGPKTRFEDLDYQDGGIPDAR